MKTSYFLFIIFLPIHFFGQETSLYHTISVPVDYENNKSSKTSVSYELGASFDTHKPTVFIIADAQQFYIRKGSVAGLQSSLFDSSYNVVGIIGRNNNADLKKMMTDSKGNTDWVRAFQVFSWQQYANDINEVRKKLVGANGHIYLYGQSGGGYLIHQFLSLYGKYVDKAFTAASVNYQLDAQSGINHDKFWHDVLKTNSDFASRFSILIKQNVVSRELIAALFQRQNFFVELDSLPSERENLLNTLLLNDTLQINGYKAKYQINAIQNLYSTAEGIPIKVRLFEFVFPLLQGFQFKADILQPDNENMYFTCLPLIKLYKKQAIVPRPMKFSELHNVQTQIIILAGRWDHTADYRSQIGLAACYPQHFLFIANDNHTFSNLKKENQYRKMISVFFLSKNREQLQMDFNNNFSRYLWKE